MKYYWCVNCGYHGAFKIYRQRNVKCEICSYEDLTELEEEEYTEWSKEYKHFQDEDVFYKSKGKLNSFGEKANGKNEGDSNVTRARK